MAFVDSLAADASAVANTSRPVPRPGQRPTLAVAPASPPKDVGARRTESKRPVWRIQCGDLISRERCVTVFVDDNEVVLVGPPGETARLTGGQLGQLRTALNEAAKLAER